MADLKMDIEEIVEILEESEGSNWAKTLMKVSWNDGPVGLEIRPVDLSTVDSGKPRVGKGARLSEEGFVVLLYKLIEMGFGDKHEIKKLLKERENSIFGDDSNADDDNEEYYDEDDIFGHDDYIRKIKIRKIKD